METLSRSHRGWYAQAALVAAVLGACDPGGSASKNDAGGVDAGSHDAGGIDAGGHDAGGHDAGGIDASRLDAGGSGTDAGLPDAGFAGDGGSSAGDSGTDAGQPPLSELAVKSTSPLNGATDVAIGSAISATFTEAVRATTVTQASFYLYHGDEGPLGGTLSTNGKTVTLVPAAPFSQGGHYTVTITTAVKAESGRALDEDYVWDFTVTAPPVLRHLVVHNNPNSSLADSYGYVKDEDGKIECGVVYDQCEADYVLGSSVTLTAVPLAGFQFTGWGWDDCLEFGTQNPVTLVLDGIKNPRDCAANWSAVPGATFKLTVTYGPWIARVKENKGDWEVSAIDCGPDATVEKCQASYAPAQNMMFRAIATNDAPAGNFKWQCTSKNPFSSDYDYYTGNVIELRFFRDTSCYVGWEPN